MSDSGVGEESFNEAFNPNNHPPTFTFPSNPTTGPSETSITPFEDPPTIVPPPSPSTMPPPSPPNVPPPSPSIVPSPSYVPSSDPIVDHDPSDGEVEDESEGDTNEDNEVGSDVHQEYIDIRASKRHFKRLHRRSRGTISDQINVDAKGPDIGYYGTNIGIRESLVGKLGGDEPYYLSDEAPSFEIDDETGWGDGEEVDQVVHKPVRRKKTPNRVVFDETSKKIVQELGLVFGSVDEFRMAVTRYAVQEKIQIEKYVNEPDRVRDIIRKELDIHVGRTTVRRARTGVLQETMGDHIVEYGSEIKHYGFTHTVDIVSRSCSCRSWQLRGIPFPHGVVFLHYKELESINYVASCYRKETYLSTYAHFIRSMNNIKMLPTSNNPIVKPSKIKIPGKPSKVRRKEANESRKIGKLSKSGVVMTYSKCGTQGHNKRGCLIRNQVGPSQSAKPSSQAEATEREQEADQVVLVQLNHQELLHRGKGKGAGTSRGRGMPPHSQTSSEATCCGRGLERGKRPVEHEYTSGGQTRPFKRPKMVGVDIYQARDGFTTLNVSLQLSMQA
ncbi:hypothetical protein H5410_041532 [Solanum commersonii]|uniref:Zinc finger PMZ-type domain-containing protein n=1 Tax=Solanum commersonii TaxID=4109 RepID=A0A9J5XTD2_SOLCO|nr:hypothetical protein H5410_041532 [Solanum commersonii]